MAELGVYIHYPWCRKRCPYCDFPIAVRRDPGQDQQYLATIVDELERRADEVPGRTLRTIYFGGGTPSLWSTTDLARVVRAVERTLGGPAEEVTLEANPTDCTAQALAAWRDAGITRLSIGVQSFDAETLAVLGRDHSMGDGERALARVLAHGWTELSVNLIFGAPGGGSDLTSVRRAAALGIPHLSLYELTVEPGTPLFAAAARGQFRPLPDEALADLYLAIDAELTGRGYRHYEVSSYGQPGHQAVHNGLYWQGREYLGLGNGAVSFVVDGDRGRRTRNPRSVGRYLAGAPAETLEELSLAKMAEDRLWLGLRTENGLAEAAFRGRSGDLDWLLQAGLAERANGRIRPTLRGFMLANQVMMRLCQVSSVGEGTLS